MYLSLTLMSCPNICNVILRYRKSEEEDRIILKKLFGYAQHEGPNPWYSKKTYPFKLIGTTSSLVPSLSSGDIVTIMKRIPTVWLCTDFGWELLLVPK